MKIFVHEFVTGGGMASETPPPGLAREARLMRRAFALDFAAVAGASVVMTLDARADDEPGPWTVVRIGPGEEAAVFARLAAEADHTLAIAPETDGALETRAHWIRDAGGDSLGCSPAAIRTAADKLESWRLFSRRDVRTPITRAWSRLEGLPRSFRYPAVLKPVDGAGCVDTLIVGSAEETIGEERFPYPSGVLQRFTPGVPMSASFLVGEGGRKRLAAVCEQRIEQADGRLSYRGGRLTGAVERCDGHVRRAVDAVRGLRGFVGVDFLWDEVTERATVVEINPRPTTSGCAIIKRLGPGFLARAWLETLDPDGPDPEGRPPLARPREAVPFAVDDDSIEVPHEFQ